MKKIITIISLALAAALIFCSCSAAKSTEQKYDMAPMENSSTNSEYDSLIADEMGGESAGITGGMTEYAPENQKLVYTTYLEIETKKFDESYDAIIKALSDADGYIADKSVRGGYTGYDEYYQSRYATFNLKVPVENYQSFLKTGESFGNIVSQSDSCDNITAAYVDTESRLAVLESQRDQLLELMDRATTMEDIITIQQSLSDVVYQIETYASQMRTYDNMVDYCTVTISLSEVTAVTAKKTVGYGEQLVDSLSDSARVVVGFFKGLLIVLIYVAPFAVIATGLFFLIRFFVRRGRAKKAKRMAAMPQAAINSPYMTPPQGNDNTKK